MERQKVKGQEGSKEGARAREPKPENQRQREKKGGKRGKSWRERQNAREPER